MPQIIVVQYSPDPIRMEWVNIGVVVIPSSSCRLLFGWIDEHYISEMFQSRMGPILESAKYIFGNMKWPEFKDAIDNPSFNTIRFSDPMKTTLTGNAALKSAMRRHISPP